MGMSNGSALLNRLMIELSISDFQAGISVVSPLVEEQYRAGSFGMIPMEEINTVKDKTAIWTAFFNHLGRNRSYYSI